MEINLNKVWKLNNNQYPLFGTANSLTEFPFMAEYVANHNSFDRNFMLKYGYMLPIWNVDDAESENGVVTQFRSDATDVIRKHKVDLQHIWDISQVAYEPLENYDRQEDRENTMSGGHTTERQGSVSETLSGGHTNERLGKVSETTTPFSSIENETKVYAFDSTTASPSDIQIEKQNGTMKVETERNGDKDVTTFNDEKKVTSHDGDKDVFNYNNEKSREISRVHGNIGVVTSQQMIESEIDLWSGFNFYNKLFDIIIEELCYFADDGDAPLLTPFQNSIF